MAARRGADAVTPRLTGPNPVCPDGHPLSVEVTTRGRYVVLTVWRCLTCGWTCEEAA